MSVIIGGGIYARGSAELRDIGILGEAALFVDDIKDTLSAPFSNEPPMTPPAAAVIESLEATPHTPALSIPGKTYQTTQGERESFSNPAERHLKLKQLMLKLTNEHRAKAGVPSVRLGDNPAAHLHAEGSLEGCYSSHWNELGMKPNHRYTLTGGTGADGENVSGSSYCIKPGENYALLGSMEHEVSETIQGWMDSPGHRRNLLNPAHTVLNVGIAYDRFNHVMVQQFGSDYISYQIRPNIDPDGILRLKGKVSRATLNISESVNIQIYFDPPLQPLTRGQLSYTYSLCNPIRAGYLVEPLPVGSYYTSPEIETETQEHPCIDPYRTDPNRPAPANPKEAHQAWSDAKRASSISPPIETESRRIISQQMDLSTEEFDIKADITPIIQKTGPGIYTVMLWGRPLHMLEPTTLSEQSIFWQTNPPSGNPYTQAASFTAKQPTYIPTPTEFLLSTSTPEFPRPITQPIRANGPSAAPTSIPNLARISTPAPVLRNIPTTNTPVPAQIIPVEIQAQPTPIKSPPGLFPVKPIVKPALTPTPPPTPIPPAIHRDNDPSHGYTIIVPQGWSTVQQGKETVFQSADGTSQIRVSVREFPKETDGREFAGSVRQEAIDIHAHKDEHFDIHGWEEDFTKEGQWRQKFVWSNRETEGSCIKTRTDMIFRSRHFPSRLKAYILTLSACAERFSQHLADWENSLESFTEVIPKT